MSKKSMKVASVVLAAAVFSLWLVINTFIVSSVGLSLVLLTLIAGSVQFFRIPPLDESRISDIVLNLFEVDVNNLKKNTIFHKGGASFAPGNTYEAIKKAIEIGVAGVEIDVNFSKDGVCLLFHGPGLEETTDGTGFIHQFSFDELQRLNVSAKDPNKGKYPVTRIPKLEECVKACVENNLLIFFDCKGDAAKTATAISELFKKYPALYRLGIVCSFYPQTIYELRQRDSNILTALTIRDRMLELVRDGVPRNKELWKRLITPFLDKVLMWMHVSFLWHFIGNSFVLLEKGIISTNFKTFWGHLGVRTVAWTVNDPLERQFLVEKQGVPVISDGLTTETVHVQT